MDIYSAIVTFFQNGGAFMYPIVLILGLGASIAIERWVFLTATAVRNKAVWNAVAPYLKTGMFEMIRKRAGWLAVLFVGESVSSWTVRARAEQPLTYAEEDENE